MSSVKTLSAANDNLIDHTRQVWQSRLDRHLSREDARQIAENVTGFFSVLAEWARAEQAAPANDPEQDAQNTGEVSHEG